MHRFKHSYRQDACSYVAVYLCIRKVSDERRKQIEKFLIFNLGNSIAGHLMNNFTQVCSFSKEI